MRTIEEAVAELRKDIHSDVYLGKKTIRTYLDEILEIHNAEKTGRWIPVSEKLPEVGEYDGDVAKYYLVQNEYGDMMVARYTHSGYWEQMYQLKPIGDQIVAWMPLPQPYKAESEDEI